MNRARGQPVEPFGQHIPHIVESQAERPGE